MADNTTDNMAVTTTADETPLPKRRGPNRTPPQLQLNLQPGDNSKYLAHSMAVMQMPPIDISNPAAVEQRIQDYLSLCGQNDMKPTVTGFCNSLGISRTTLFDWKHGNFREDTHQAIILRAYGILEELWESYMQNGKINPVSGIFLGKNNFGYQDKQEYVLTPNQRQEIPAELIESKYEELPE